TKLNKSIRQYQRIGNIIRRHNRIANKAMNRDPHLCAEMITQGRLSGQFQSIFDQFVGDRGWNTKIRICQLFTGQAKRLEKRFIVITPAGNDIEKQESVNTWNSL